MMNLHSTVRLPVAPLTLTPVDPLYQLQAQFSLIKLLVLIDLISIPASRLLLRGLIMEANILVNLYLELAIHPFFVV